MDLMRAAAALTSTLSAAPLEIPLLEINAHASPASALGISLGSPSASVVIVTGVTHVEMVDRPLEISLASIGLLSNCTATAVSCNVTANAILIVGVHVEGRPSDYHTAQVSACRFGDGWIARALIHPACWSDATSITLVSLTLAGRPLPCDCLLPATLRVRYNHIPTTAGEVVAAADAGDVAALQAALLDGGSTEEAGCVSRKPQMLHLRGVRTYLPVSAHRLC